MTGGGARIRWLIGELRAASTRIGVESARLGQCITTTAGLANEQRELATCADTSSVAVARVAIDAREHVDTVCRATADNLDAIRSAHQDLSGVSQLNRAVESRRERTARQRRAEHAVAARAHRQHQRRREADRGRVRADEAARDQRIDRGRARRSSGARLRGRHRPAVGDVAAAPSRSGHAARRCAAKARDVRAERGD